MQLKRSSPTAYIPTSKRCLITTEPDTNIDSSVQYINIEKKNGDHTDLDNPHCSTPLLVTPTCKYRMIRYIKCFNLAFEYVNKYNICQVLDRGVFPENWTSYRLRKETIYFDDCSERYELRRYLRNDPLFQKNRNFCLSAVKQNYIFDTATMKQTNIPFDNEMVIPIRDHISWYDIRWGFDRVTIKDIVIKVRYLHFELNTIDEFA